MIGALPSEPLLTPSFIQRGMSIMNLMNTGIMALHVVAVWLSLLAVKAQAHPVKLQVQSILRQNFGPGGLTYDPCLSAFDNCIPPRICAEVNGECTPTSNACVCVPPDRFSICNTSSNCVYGERCITALTHRYCVSCAVAERSNMTTVDDGISCIEESDYNDTDDGDASATWDPAESGTSSGGGTNGTGSGIDAEEDDDNSNGTDNENSSVCIAAVHLQHLSSADLVFTNHKRAFVLCDTQGSCATPGHIVLLNREPMTMRSYCALQETECIRRVMRVNSPRIQVKARINSYTNGLEFTALAAKYDSWIEQKVLAMLIRLRL